MRALVAIFRKEMKDHLRDRRSLFSGLLMPLVGPLTVLVMFTLIASWTREDRPLEIAVAGGKNAPNLVAFLQRHGAVIREAPPDYEALVRDGKLDVVLAVPEDFGKDFEAGRSAPIQIVQDSSRNKARSQVERARRLVEAYGRKLGARRMIARGVSPVLVAPLETTTLDLATPEKTAANVLGMLPLFLLLATFIGGLHVAIDSTAGERERGSLEPLLVNPVSSIDVAMGKWAAVVISIWLALAVSLAGFSVAIARVPLQDLGIRFQLGLPEISGILAAVVPMALFVAALETTLALFARTFKEAQTYLSMVMMVPILPASFLSLQPIRPTAMMMRAPVLGQTVLMTDVLRGEAPPMGWFVIAAAASLAGTAALLALASRMLRSEKIVFGRGAGG